MKTLQVGDTLTDLARAAKVYLGEALVGRTDFNQHKFTNGYAHTTCTRFGPVRLKVLWEYDDLAGHYVPHRVGPLTVSGAPGGVKHFRFIDLPVAVALAKRYGGPNPEDVCLDMECPGLDTDDTADLPDDRYVDPDKTVSS